MQISLKLGSPKLLLLMTGIVLIQGLSQTLGRSQTLCLFRKEGTSRWLIIIDQSPCYPFLEKSLKNYFQFNIYVS